MKNSKSNGGVDIMNMKKKRTAHCASLAIAILAAVTTTGCGMAQAVSDSTVDAAKWVFTTQVKQMNVDLKGRTAVNADAQGKSLSTVIRFYQLKDEKTFGQLSYSQLQTDDLKLLKTDLLATKDVVLRPDTSATITEPMNPDAQFVGVVAFFRDPVQDRAWKLTIPKKQWKKTDPVKIEVNSNELALVDAKSQPVKHSAPQQSVPATPASAASTTAAAAPAPRADSQTDARQQG